MMQVCQLRKYTMRPKLQTPDYYTYIWFLLKPVAANLVAHNCIECLYRLENAQPKYHPAGHYPLHKASTMKTRFARVGVEELTLISLKTFWISWVTAPQVFSPKNSSTTSLMPFWVNEQIPTAYARKSSENLSQKSGAYNNRRGGMVCGVLSVTRPFLDNSHAHTFCLAGTLLLARSLWIPGYFI